MAFKILGGLLVVFGVVDFGGSFAGFDLWGTLGVPLPEIIWRFSAYLEIGAGYALINLGKAAGDAEVATPSQG